MDEAKWYVVHTYSGYENKVKANIEKTVENRNLQDQVLEVSVTGFVGPGSKPVPLTPAEIKSLGITLPGTEAPKPVVQFAGKVGDQVMILSGAWENTVGEITAINDGKQCLTINVEMFGRETPVEIGFTDVKLM